MFKSIKTAIRSHYDGYTQIGRFWLSLAIVALVVDACISYQYGITLTTLHGLGFALVAVFFSLLPDAAYSEFESKRFASGLALGCLCVPLGVVAFYSHLGYGAGVRLGDMQQTGVQNTKFDDARKSLTSDRTNLDMWRKQLNELEAANAWTATIKADGLRAELAPVDKAIELEANRKGCKTKCQKLMEKKADLEGRIAIAEKSEDLTKRIEATQRIIDTKTAEAAKSEYKSSSVVNQNNIAAQLWLAVTGAAPSDAIKPDETTSSFTSIVIAGGGSLAFMLMAPIGFFVAGRNRVPGGVPASFRTVSRHETGSPHTQTTSNTEKQTVITNVYKNTDALRILAGLGNNRVAA
jgi:hypothetical protein